MTSDGCEDGRLLDRRHKAVSATAHLALAVLLLGMLPGASARAVEPTRDERLAAAGAALVYNIARFSTWPPSRGETFDVCLADEGAVPAFETIVDREVDGRAVRVSVVPAASVRNAGCEVFFLSGAKRGGLPEEPPYGTLVVGTQNGVLQWGGAVRIALEGARPAFGVNVANAAKAGVEPSAQLLQLAEEVVR